MDILRRGLLECSDMLRLRKKPGKGATGMTSFAPPRRDLTQRILRTSSRCACDDQIEKREPDGRFSV